MGHYPLGHLASDRQSGNNQPTHADQANQKHTNEIHTERKKTAQVSDVSDVA